MSAGLSVSVVMATFNGSRFLAEQLRSIANQDRPPDEVLVADDGSTDSTLEILDRVLAETGMNAEVSVNPTRLGAVRSFEALVRRARGDLIFLADQDDVWLPGKVSVMTEALTAHPDAGAAFSDAYMIDGSGRHIGSSLWKALGFSPAHQDEWHRGEHVSVLVRRSPTPGATIAFKSRVRDLILPFPEVGFHDFWLLFLVAQASSAIALPRPLMKYRLHDANQIGLARRSPLRSRADAADERAAELAQFLALRDRLAARGVMTDPAAELLGDKIDHLRFRSGLPASPAQRAWLVGVRYRRGEYRRYARGLRSAIADILRGPAA